MMKTLGFMLGMRSMNEKFRHVIGHLRKNVVINKLFKRHFVFHKNVCRFSAAQTSAFRYF
jgi:hypothetical protein